MKTNGKLGIVIFVIILTIIGSWLLGRYYQDQIYSPIDPTSKETVSFVVNSGESGSSVGNRLAEQKLIRSPLAFRVYLRLSQLAGSIIQAGEYNLKSSMSLAEMVESFKHGTFDIKLTIPEGFRIEEVAGLIIS
ncbi:MAG: endolytic transglycosylase MltG, partial [Candidatus Cloacimonetes bacterium]|nr:endolytic transglycosylase MltG [Candidatus Cloacimonadota bacterium]